jgi:regulator of RNase E activity RraB
LTQSGATDEDLLYEARKHKAAFHHKLLEKATLDAIQLFYQAFLSFTGSRQVVLTRLSLFAG